MLECVEVIFMQTLQEVTVLADKLSPVEKIRLIKHLATSLESVMFERLSPQSLYGSWKGNLPEDLDTAERDSVQTENFKDSREILLSQAGALKDDDMIDELLANIYKERGRPMIE
jgi:hypothetical protein